MKGKQKVKDNPGLIRDSFSKALINIDRTGYINNKKRKQIFKKKDAEIAELKNDVQVLAKDNKKILRMLSNINKKMKINTNNDDN